MEQEHSSTNELDQRSPQAKPKPLSRDQMLERMKQTDSSPQELNQPEPSQQHQAPKNREELDERMRQAAIAAGQDPDQNQEMAEAYGF